ncbi:MAG: hypothetical protein ACRDLY_15610 [Thermoleophilaceae bacterium]
MTPMAAMLHPEVRWYGADDRLREQGSEAVVGRARDRIASGVLRDAELTTWERVGDRLVVGARLRAGDARERTFLCTLCAGRIVEVRDCASRDEALARLVGG